MNKRYKLLKDLPIKDMVAGVEIAEGGNSWYGYSPDSPLIPIITISKESFDYYGLGVIEWALKQTDWVEELPIEAFSEGLTLKQWKCQEVTRSGFEYPQLTALWGPKRITYLKAQHVLMKYAEVVNGDWKPNWNNSQYKWSIYFDHEDNNYGVDSRCSVQQIDLVYFLTMKLAEQAIIDCKEELDIIRSSF